MVDPSLGTWNYVYDRQGRLTGQKDAKNQWVCLYYDALERLTLKQMPDLPATCAATPPALAQSDSAIWYTYGTAGSAIGQLMAVSRTVLDGVSHINKSMTCDAFGRLQQEQRVLRGSPAAPAVTYGYDAWGRLATTTYPTGEVVTVQYNGMGLEARLTSSTQGLLVSGDAAGSGTLAGGGASLTADAVDYDVVGRVLSMKLGSGVWRVNEYKAFTEANDPHHRGGRLIASRVDTVKGQGSLLLLGYTYDAHGTPTDLGESLLGSPATNNLTSYDALGRLTSAYGMGFTWADGNASSFENHAQSYGQGAAGQPLYSVLSTGTGGVFTYDANGNMVSRKGNSSAAVQTLSWSPLNELQMVRTENGAVDPYEYYRYDENGERFYQEQALIDASGVTTRTALLLSYWPFYEVDRQNGDAVMTSYYFGGQRIAQKPSGGALTFLHSDHVGSVRVTSNGAGDLPTATRRSYHAFGRTRTGGGEAFASRWRFTGQEEELSGLVYMHARYYDPVTGRFVSPDTIVLELQRVWRTLVPVAAEPGASQARLAKGLRTPEEAFRLPIPRALRHLGGKGMPKQVTPLVFEQMRERLNAWDLKPMAGKRATTRWMNTAYWCRNSMVAEGLMRKDSRHGVWETSEAGRSWLAAQEAGGATRKGAQGM